MTGKGFADKICKIVAVFLCISLAGCAGTRSNIIGYSKETPQVKKFKDLSDREALEMVVELYNAKPSVNEDVLAKNIALQTYVEQLRKRKSKYLESSGIFDLEYTPVGYEKWDDKKIVALYKYLDSKIYAGSWDRISELPEEDRRMMVIRITARDVVYKEGRHRDIVRQSAEIAGQVLMTALSILASVI